MTASKDLNAGFRAMLLKRGRAMPHPDGGAPRFPINDAADVKKAVDLVGRVPDEHKPAVRRHIIRNAKKPDINGVRHLPGHWNVDGSLKDSDNDGDTDANPTDGDPPSR